MSRLRTSAPDQHFQEVFKTGALAQICKVAPRTVADWFDEGSLKGFRIPGSQDRRVPRKHLLTFLDANFAGKGRQWLEEWDRGWRVRRVAKLGNPVLIFTAGGESTQAVLEHVSALLAEKGFQSQTFPDAFECGACFAQSPNCRAIAIIVPKGTELPLGFPTPPTFNSQEGQLVLYFGDTEAEAPAEEVPSPVPAPSPPTPKRTPPAVVRVANQVFGVSNGQVVQPQICPADAIPDGYRRIQLRVTIEVGEATPCGSPPYGFRIPETLRAGSVHQVLVYVDEPIPSVLDRPQPKAVVVKTERTPRLLRGEMAFQKLGTQVLVLGL